MLYFSLISIPLSGSLLMESNRTISIISINSWTGSENMTTSKSRISLVHSAWAQSIGISTKWGFLLFQSNLSWVPRAEQQPLRQTKLMADRQYRQTPRHCQVYHPHSGQEGRESLLCIVAHPWKPKLFYNWPQEGKKAQWMTAWVNHMTNFPILWGAYKKDGRRGTQRIPLLTPPIFQQVLFMLCLSDL